MKLRGVLAAGVPILFLLAALVWIPTRITYSAGSLRCGTALNPNEDRDCELVAQLRIQDAFKATATLGLIGAAWVATYWIFRRKEWLALDLAFAVVMFLVLLVSIGWMTGAYSVD